MMNTPGEAIHKFCVACVGSPFEVKDCGGDHRFNGGCAPSSECWFYKFRLGKGRPSVKLIRKYCLFCQGGSSDLVRDCVEGEDHSGVKACSLFPYRLGTNPNISEETKQKRREVAMRSGFGQKFPPEVVAVPQIRGQNQRTGAGTYEPVSGAFKRMAMRDMQ
jgi:hypothetical protein